MGFDLSKYDTVDSRIKKFYKKYPEGKIETKLISDVNNIKFAVFKASIYDSDAGDIGRTIHLLATGHAFEVAGDGFVNKHCHLENCETSAIGRALANMGMSGSLRPSQSEMEKVEVAEAKDKKRQLLIAEIKEYITENKIKLDDSTRAILNNKSSDYNALYDEFAKIQKGVKQ